MSWSKFLNLIPSLDPWIEAPFPFSYIERKDMQIGNHLYPHFLYEGNNYEFLLYLKESASEVLFDYIFVDPPYNSHRDVIVNDFPGNSPPIWNSGCSHIQWLKMMYIRLKLCSLLLRSDTGIIQICCDDKEFAYLRLMADLIFGEFNFIGTYIWKSMKSVKNNTIFTHNHTYILTYARDKQKRYSQSPNTVQEYEEKGSILDQFPDSIQAREHLFTSLENFIPLEYIRFLNPKPQRLLRYFLGIWANHTNARILDLFSGTGSMFLAAIQQNLHDSLHRQILGCQYPFPLAKFFREESITNVKKKKATFFDLTLARLNFEVKHNDWFELAQISVFKQILKSSHI